MSGAPLEVGGGTLAGEVSGPSGATALVGPVASRVLWEGGLDFGSTLQPRATAGDVNATSTWSLYARNLANTADAAILRWSGGNLIIGDTATSVSSLLLYGYSQAVMQAAGAVQVVAPTVYVRASAFAVTDANSVEVVRQTMNGIGPSRADVGAGVTSYAWGWLAPAAGGGYLWSWTGQAAAAGSGANGGPLAISGGAGDGAAGRSGTVGVARLNPGCLVVGAIAVDTTLSDGQSAASFFTAAPTVGGLTLRINRLPAVGEFALVRNLNSVGGSLTVAWASGTGIVCPSGAAIIISGDGTNAILMMQGT